MAAGSIPRKFKDRIDMMKKKEEESTAQFDNVMRDIQDVRSSPRQFSGNIGVGGGSGMVIPRHLSPGHPAHHPQFRYGGSLPNVNQMAGGSVSPTPTSPISPGQAPGQVNHDVLLAMSGMTQLSPSVPLSPVTLNCSEYPDNAHAQSVAAGQQRSVAGDRSRGGVSPSGGGAIRTRSGERRWDSSPYSDKSPYYSSSLVTTYLSPPPESRWRRTISDSALYQKLTNPPSPSSQRCPSEQGSPEYCSPVSDQDVKPPPELLQSLREDLLHPVKEEPGGIINGDESHSQYPVSSSGHQSPVPLYTSQYLPQQQNNLEEKFQKFRLEPPFQDSGGNFLQQHNPSTPTTGPTSPHTPGSFPPEIYIEDWTQHNKTLEDDFSVLRQDLEPIDDQLLATLTSSVTFVDPATEEQFKMNNY